MHLLTVMAWFLLQSSSEFLLSVSAEKAFDTRIYSLIVSASSFLLFRGYLCNITLDVSSSNRSPLGQISWKNKIKLSHNSHKNTHIKRPSHKSGILDLQLGLTTDNYERICIFTSKLSWIELSAAYSTEWIKRKLGGTPSLSGINAPFWEASRPPSCPLDPPLARDWHKWTLPLEKEGSSLWDWKSAFLRVRSKRDWLREDIQWLASLT